MLFKMMLVIFRDLIQHGDILLIFDWHAHVELQMLATLTGKRPVQSVNL